MRTFLPALLCLFALAGSIHAYGDFDYEFVALVGISPSASENHDVRSGGSVIGESDTKAGYSLAFEGYIHVADNFAWGLGISTLGPHEIDVDGSDPVFDFTPIYASLMIHGMRLGQSYGYLNLQYGVNMTFNGNSDYAGDEDLEGKSYMAGGLGIVLAESYRVELRYANYEGTVEFLGSDLDIRHAEWSLMFGYQF